MRKILLLLMLSPLMLTAQSKFGFYSHKEVLESVPGYSQSMAEYELLKQRCEAEIESNEQELTRKYVAFLDGQQDFPELILRKRQKELQQMVDNSVLFRGQLKVWLRQAKDSLLSQHNSAIDAALQKVCVRKELAYAINSDEIKYRYINPNVGVDITAELIDEILHPVVEPDPVECDGKEEGDGEYIATDVIAAATDSITVATDSITVSGIKAVATDSIKVAADSISTAVDTVEVVSDSIVLAVDSLAGSKIKVDESVKVKEEKE